MNKTFRTLVVVFSCLLTCVCALTITSVIMNNVLDSISLIGLCFVLISLLFGFVYLILGFSKDLSKIYKTCILIGTLNALMSIVLSLKETYNTVALITTVIAFGLYVVLLVGTNLGKVKSYVLCILIIIIRIMGIVANYMLVKDILHPQVLNIIGQLAIILMVFIATSAKYIDKENRGSK